MAERWYVVIVDQHPNGMRSIDEWPTREGADIGVDAAEANGLQAQIVGPAKSLVEAINLEPQVFGFDEDQVLVKYSKPHADQVRRAEEEWRRPFSGYRPTLAERVRELWHAAGRPRRD